MKKEFFLNFKKNKVGWDQENDIGRFYYSHAFLSCKSLSFRMIPPLSRNQTLEQQQVRKAISSRIIDTEGEYLGGVNVIEAGTINGNLRRELSLGTYLIFSAHGLTLKSKFIPFSTVGLNSGFFFGNEACLQAYCGKTVRRFSSIADRIGNTIVSLLFDIESL